MRFNVHISFADGDYEVEADSEEEAKDFGIEEANDSMFVEVEALDAEDDDEQYQDEEDEDDENES